MEREKMVQEKLSRLVLDAAMRVHTTLGPGLYEEVYKVCLKHELSASGCSVRSEVPIPILYKGATMEVGYRCDLLVEDTMIVELKSLPEFSSIHRVQLLTYLRMAEKEVGLMLNFNTVHLRNGILRIVNTRTSEEIPVMKESTAEV